MYFLLAFVTVAAAAIVYAISKLAAINRFWPNRGVPCRPAIPLFGNMFDLVIGRKSHDDIVKGIRDAFPDAPVVGYYYFVSPRLIVNDLDLVERLLIKDFQHFTDRVRVVDSELGANLFGLTGNAWRALRTKFSPMFTVGKLRSMFRHVSNIGDDFVRTLADRMDNVNVKEETSRFAMDVIGTCVFGIEPGTVGEPENEFSREGRLVFKPSLVDFIRKSAVVVFPKFSKKLNLTFSPKRSVDYFSKIVRNALESRKAGNIVRKDFIQLMVTLQEKGYVELEKNDPNDDYLNIDDKSFDVDSKIELTDDLMVGQAFVFLVAGFEATASTMAFMCMEFASNPDVQEKAREEILKITKNNDELTYDVVKDMRYLDNCVKETLRLHTPVGHLLRVCVKTYQMPGTALTLTPGDTVVVPSQAIHTDANIYRNPDRFWPERWNVTESVKRPPCSYLAFGDGPRMCIGMRFAIMEVKCCLAKILLKYRIKKHPNLKLPVKTNPHSFFNEPIEPILCNLELL